MNIYESIFNVDVSRPFINIILHSILSKTELDVSQVIFGFWIIQNGTVQYNR